MGSLTAIKRRLQGHKQIGGEFENLDLRSASAFQSSWERVVFRNCKLSLSDFSGAKLYRVVFDTCHLEATSFAGATLDDVEFHNCGMDQASFVGSVIRRGVFHGSRMQLASFANGTVDNTSLVNCNLRGADLTFIEKNGKLCILYCNLHEAKVALGCSFFNAGFDSRAVAQFIAMVARVDPDPSSAAILKGLAGRQYDVVCRLMDDREKTDAAEAEEAEPQTKEAVLTMSHDGDGREVA